MAGRAMWRAAVEFGKVRVPVKMYAAVRPERVQFHLLHDKDKTRLQQQWVCELEEKPVDREEVVRGAQVDEDKYVVLEPDELEALEPETSRSITVTAFVKADQVDARYCDHPYYLGPDGQDEHYAALAKVLRETGTGGLCQWTVRKRSYTGLLRCSGGPLELVTLRPAGEVRAVKELSLPSAKVSARELKTAQYLVNELSAPFQPAQHRDEFTQALQELVEAKAAGKKITPHKAAKKAAVAPDRLLATLEKSVAAAQKARKHAA
jgi:DNA end-binding protein Ku